MPPPSEASQTFSFHKFTIPSKESEDSFKKQEIGVLERITHLRSIISKMNT